jgi:hypothetical protein
MTNVPRSSAKQGSTKASERHRHVPVDGVKLREPLGPDKARLAAIDAFPKISTETALARKAPANYQFVPRCTPLHAPAAATPKDGRWARRS